MSGKEWWQQWTSLLWSLKWKCFIGNTIGLLKDWEYVSKSGKPQYGVWFILIDVACLPHTSGQDFGICSNIWFNCKSFLLLLRCSQHTLNSSFYSTFQWFWVHSQGFATIITNSRIFHSKKMKLIRYFLPLWICVF